MYPLFFHFDAVNVNWNVTHEHSAAQASIHLFYDLAEIHFVRSHRTAHTQPVSTLFRGAFLWSFLSFFFTPFLSLGLSSFLCSCIYALYAIEFSEKENDCKKKETSHQFARTYKQLDVGCWAKYVCWSYSCRSFHTYDNFLSYFLNMSTPCFISVARSPVIRPREMLSMYRVCVCAAHEDETHSVQPFSKDVYVNPFRMEEKLVDEHKTTMATKWLQATQWNDKIICDHMKCEVNLIILFHWLPTSFHSSVFFSLTSTPCLTFCQCYHFLRYACFFVLIPLLRLSSVDRFAVYVVVCFIYDACSLAFCTLTVAAATTTTSTDVNYEYFMNGKWSCFFTM